MPTSGRWAWRARTRSHARALPQRLVVRTPAPAPSYFRVLLLFLLAELLNLSELALCDTRSPYEHGLVQTGVCSRGPESPGIQPSYRSLAAAGHCLSSTRGSSSLPEPRFPGTDGEGPVSLFSYTEGPDWGKRRADQVCRHVGENHTS